MTEQEKLVKISAELADLADRLATLQREVEEMYISVGEDK